LELFNKKELNQLDFLHDQINTNPSEERVKNKNKKIEKILIIDTETTGLDENKDEVIEIGCILFDVSFKCVLSQVSFLFPVNNNEAEHVNGISPEVTNISQPWEDGLNFFLKLVDLQISSLLIMWSLIRNGLEKEDCLSLIRNGYVV